VLCSFCASSHFSTGTFHAYLSAATIHGMYASCQCKSTELQGCTPGCCALLTLTLHYCSCTIAPTLDTTCSLHHLLCHSLLPLPRWASICCFRHSNCAICSSSWCKAQ
jgi:hypothetical protein